jgi:hypothetical protein
MHRKIMGLPSALIALVVFSALLSGAWQQPPESKIESKIDPSDPLLQTIKERMGKLPRLDPEDQVGESKGVGSKRTKGASNKHRAAELMLKSARLLESEERPELVQMAKELRKQVAVILQKD